MSTQNTLELPLKVGTWYLTRYGKKHKILSLDLERDGGETIVAQTDSGDITCYFANGSFYHDGPSNKDLVSEIKPSPVVNWDAMPAWANWVAMEPNRPEWYWYDLQPEINPYGPIWDRSFTSGRSFGQIPAAFAPTFTGDWKESLTQRPQ